MALRGSIPRGTDEKKNRLHHLKGHRNAATIDATTTLHGARDQMEFPSLDVFDPPEWMNRNQKKIFSSILNDILALDIAVTSDKLSVMSLCIEYTGYLDACEQLAIEGMVIIVIDRGGNEVRKPHPLLQERARRMEGVRKLMSDFGMTPNTRRLLKTRNADAPKDKEDEDWAKFMNGGGRTS
jgi:P27 family predicted phage terminase small subunit